VSENIFFSDFSLMTIALKIQWNWIFEMRLFQ